MSKINVTHTCEKYIPAVLFSITDGNAGEINSTGQFGHSYDGGELSTSPYFPLEELDNLDVSKATYVQVVWTNIDGNTGQGVTFTVLYDHDAFEAGVLTAPATALNTALIEDPEHDTPYVIQKTEKGIIDANTLTAGVPIAFRVVGTTVDKGEDPGCWFMGLLLTQ